jgi:hypothetical protein
MGREMTFKGKCPICKRFCNQLTKHHKWRRAVWGKKKNSDVIYICRKCHDELEIAITKKENNILRKFPEIYRDVLSDFLENGVPNYTVGRRK